ncbi:MAG TPA: NAD(P)H-dependent oxidoreductase subunit E [Anaerolineales bacterium]|nr:NAD(P)H-dependent oxidoreductase subunit E [Anaerolineales bacterium]
MSQTPEPFATYLDEISHRGRTMLLPALHKATELYGWVSQDVQEQISRALRVPAAEVHGVVEFYSMFYQQPTAKRVIRVCEDPACSAGGASAVLHELEAQLSIQVGETTADGSVTLEAVTCLGMCEHAPCALDANKPAGMLDPQSVSAFLAGELPEPVGMPYGNPLWILQRVGKVDPTSLADYLAMGGYQGLQKAIAQTPEALLEQLDASGVLGRGGAQFPTGRKWRMVRQAAGTPQNKHVVVNADESEPGTFKDRYLLEEDPFALIEATTLASYVIGAQQGWIFVRGEYPRAVARLQNAIDQARAAGWLGKNILGQKGFDFDIELRVGAGAYICGEETALFEAIEGKRGFPRIKPPFPVTHGLFHQPTAINNVETLVAALAVINVGLDAWKAVGTEKSPGTKLFCVSGHVAKPGVYELPFASTLADLLALAGGVANGRQLQAVLMGGAAGAFVAPHQLDLRLTYEDTRAANVPLGSGVVMVFDDSVDLRQVLYELARFFKHESCGKCFPCQLGSQRQYEILDRLAHHTPYTQDLQTLGNIGYTMTKTSLCGLGQTATSAISSAVRLWPHLLNENATH